ncbi:aldehyde dehydrogenase family protein [Streptomyces sp. NPDC050549]|uniref:aldehyde dehydrogenase family protein n=1 Tax=Streptomyces sp. NPDC050549 TaxID=3155406 RepID=UPI003431550F
MAPLISAAAVERVCGMFDRARRDKAGRITLGGSRAGGDLADKNLVEPTIIVDVDPEHEIAQTEVFGPVLLVFRFSNEDEAVALANSTPYGLGANIQSTSLTGVHRVAERLKAGGVYVNGARQNLPYTPFDGLGLSGYGKEGGRAGTTSDRPGRCRTADGELASRFSQVVTAEVPHGPQRGKPDEGRSDQAARCCLGRDARPSSAGKLELRRDGSSSSTRTTYRLPGLCGWSVTPRARWYR